MRHNRSWSYPGRMCAWIFVVRTRSAASVRSFGGETCVSCDVCSVIFIDLPSSRVLYVTGPSWTRTGPPTEAELRALTRP